MQKIISRIFAILLIILTASIFIFSTGIKKTDGVVVDDRITTDIYDANGKIEHFDGNVFTPPTKGSRIIFTIDLPEDISKNNVLCFLNYNSVIKVYYKDEMIYSFGEHKYKMGHLTGHSCERVVIPQDAKGEVKIEYLQLEDYTTSQLVGVKLMPPEIAWLYPISDAWKQTQFSLFIMFLLISFITLIFYTVMWFKGFESGQGIAESLFCISLTAWAFGFTGYQFVLSDDITIVPFFEYAAFYLTPLFLASYMFFGFKKESFDKKVFRIMAIFYFVLFITATLWQAFLPDHAGYTELLNVCHSSLLIGAVFVIISILKNKKDYSLVMRYGIILTLVVSLTEVVRVLILRTGIARYHNLHVFTEMTFTPFIVLAFEITVMTDYAVKVYKSYVDRLETEKLKTLAYYDGLTGLNNRTAFDRFERRNLSKQGEYTLAFIDADGLKAANDLYGHETGDELLRIVSNAIRNGSDKNGCRAYRYGGDEFIVVSEEKDEVQKAVSEMHKKLKNTDNYKMPFEITASVGIITHEEDSKATVDDVIKEADGAMYVDKEKNHHTRENVIAEIKKRKQETKTEGGRKD